MPADSSLVTFRVTQDEHDLLRAVANYRGESLSAFVRTTALYHARQVLADVGPDTVIEGDRSREVARQSKAAQRLEERLDNLRRQAAEADEADPIAGQRHRGR